MQTPATAYAPRNHYVPVYLVLVPWFLVILAMGYDNTFVPAEAGQPPVLLLLTGVISLTAFTLWYNFNAAFKSFVLNFDMRLLILLHSWRTLGVSFLLFYSVGELPAVFALPAGIGDAIAAVWAVFLAYSMFTNPNGVSRKSIAAWNRFGIFDFIIAVSAGVLARDGGIFHSAGLANSDAMSTFPFVIIPAFLVQVFMLSHIMIYLQLRNNWANSVRVNIKP